MIQVVMLAGDLVETPAAPEGLLQFALTDEEARRLAVSILKQLPSDYRSHARRFEQDEANGPRVGDYRTAEAL